MASAATLAVHFLGACAEFAAQMNQKVGHAATLIGIVVFLLGAVLSARTLVAEDVSSVQKPLTHSAYVWQRSWTEPVREAVVQHGAEFDELVVLGAEVSWKDKQPQATRVGVDYSALAGTNCRVGLALRIGGFSGPFVADDANAQLLGAVAESLIAEARTNAVMPYELQLDFDCAQSKLDGYRVWLAAIQNRLAPMPVTITVLPSWLGEPAFKRLAASATNYVLQVHSLERPGNIKERFNLCDPQAARRAIEQAGKIGVPFRVALPTYGYLLAFDKEGKFVGLSAETGKSWPRETQIKVVRADPVEMAGLVERWNINRPAALDGVLWYRLPVAVDNLNWRWPTLGAIVHSRSLRAGAQVETRRVEAGVVEINLVNDGNLDISSRFAVAVRWSREGGARLVSGDGLLGFTLVEGEGTTADFRIESHDYHLPAGVTNTIGWLRFNRDCEVKVELKKD